MSLMPTHLDHIFSNVPFNPHLLPQGSSDALNDSDRRYFFGRMFSDSVNCFIFQNRVKKIRSNDVLPLL